MPECPPKEEQPLGSENAPPSAAPWSENEEPAETRSGAVFWVTGLVNSGKSTFARLLAKELRGRGEPVVLLDSDKTRKILGSKFGFGREDRRYVAEIYAQLCAHISAHGVAVVCATGSLFEDVRRWNRKHIPIYREIYIRAPEDVIVSRHPKGIYAAARAGRIRQVPGIDQYAELPASPDLVVDNDALTTIQTLGIVASQYVGTITEKPYANSLKTQKNDQFPTTPIENVRTRPSASADQKSQFMPPTDGDALWRLSLREGISYLREGSADKAVASLSRAASIFPDHILTILNLGTALQRAHQHEQARHTFEKAIRLDPTCSAAYHGLGITFAALDQNERAIRAFEEAARHDPDAWKSWLSVAELTSDEQKWLNARECALNSMRGAWEKNRTNTPLALEYAKVLRKLKKFEAAFNVLQIAHTSVKEKSDILAARANTYYRMGAFEEAFRHEHDALAALSAEVLPTHPQQIFLPDRAIQALIELKSVLEANGIEFFLAAGTLLGFYRNGGPLPYDRDIDIGIIGIDQAPRVADTIRKSPYLRPPAWSNPTDKYLPLSHRGTTIDIFYHSKQPGYLTCGFSDNAGDIKWRFTNFRLKKMTFSAGTFLVPENTEQYLCETYGTNWRTPDVNFVSAVNSPALHDVSPFARAYISAHRSRKSFLFGYPEKAQSLIRQSPVCIALPNFINL